MRNPNYKGRIKRAEAIINEILGNQSKVIPATPIHMINILQNLDGIGTGPQDISQYGYLFDNIIQRNLSAIDITDAQTKGIFIEILSTIAFEMLLQKVNNFAQSDIVASVDRYKRKYKIKLDANDLIGKLIMARMIKKDTIGNYRFSYSYIFYYFVARYISEHIKDKEVEEKIFDMSTHLHIEAYGNIMIFVCYFANSAQIIENVLINAYYLYDDIKPFDFREQNGMMESINSTVDKYLKPRVVGEEEDVSQQKKKELISKDEQGIGDGSTRELTDDDYNDVDESELKIAMYFNAMKTIDVLGQIVSNYPGKIPGEEKCRIVDEIHQLGLRTIEVFLDSFGYLQEEIISTLAEYAREKNKNALADEIINLVKIAFSSMIISITRMIIQRIALLLGNEHLEIVNEEVLHKDNSVSGQLILFDIYFNRQNKPQFPECIKYNKWLKEKKLTLAVSILQDIIAEYLINNTCGAVDMRDKVCAELGIQKKEILIAKSRELLQ